ncbi:peroxisomal membrane protein PEX14 isoform X1 [Culex quinquefasciatus]|uniref:peroxisomal membrane protein PEX14 isoform X1 n=1 Tax=Culex quinquefasciatus TaxID=7176 RepID=UPI0018E3380F|nr:peroxisomal membrane protein PEX14 isoform X1 [Culex quinquefasciatus]
MSGDGDEAPPQQAIPPAVPPREHLITTAIKFLNNPNVLRSAVGQKQAFLRSKGLTEDEIQLACERAGVFSREPVQQNHQTVISMDVGTGGGGGGVAKASYSVQPQSWFGRVREVLNSVALISGLMYGVYMFYKKFIEPLLFRSKKKKPVDEQLADLSRTVEGKIDKLSGELVKIKDELTRVNQAQSAAKELAAFKTDLDSIKGLLLNRKQFASPNLPIVPPSIPAWQLQSQSQQEERTPNSEGEPDKIDDNDTGSGSGSSENDVVLKNSDSSLEIIS